MSIFGSFFGIDDEREWIADLEADGIKAGVIRARSPAPADQDAPWIYQGSHVLPGPGDPRGGSVDLALIAAHVRFWREHPDAPVEDEPEKGCEPFLRLSVHESRSAPDRSLGDACVLLSVEQVVRMRDALSEWIAAASEEVRS